ncbi:MAG TPA: hypothetical protein VKX17_15105 [Planctomycetota bacterium]|nr:hypothetical protein [Planctomycetota bacterium]
MNDHIVEEVRANRAKLFESCGNDFEKLFQHMHGIAERLGMRSVSSVEELRESVRLRPERAKHTSPGQRPGFGTNGIDSP